MRHAYMLLLCACAAAPRPVAPALAQPWPTPLGNEQRAGYENEIVSDSLDVVWDIDAGAGMRATPLVTDSAIFAGSTNRQLLAFNTRNGGRYWDQRLDGEIPGEIVRSGSTLFLATAEWNGHVHARDMRLGKLRWRYEVGPTRFGPIVEGGIVYIGGERGYVHALRSEDGQQVWRARITGSVAGVPLNVGDAVIVSSVRDTLYRINKRDGAMAAGAHIESTQSAPAALRADTLVLATYSGVVLGVQATSLATLWRVDTGAPVLAAPIVASDGTIHILNRNSEIWRIAGGMGRKIATLPGAVGTSFTLVRDRYIIGSLDGTLWLTRLDGTVVAEHTFNQSIAAPVAVHGGAVYVPLRRGRLVKLR